MGVLVIKKYFEDVSLVAPTNVLVSNYVAPTASTAGYITYTWVQEVLNNNPGNTAMVIKSIATQFRGNKHGFFDAELQMDWLGDNFTMAEEFTDVSGNNSRGLALGKVDCGWDPTSDSSFQCRPMHLRVGEVPQLRRNLRFSLAARLTAVTGPLINQSPAVLNSGNLVPNAWYNPTDLNPTPTNPIWPMYMEIVFEYDTSNRN